MEEIPFGLHKSVAKSKLMLVTQENNMYQKLVLCLPKNFWSGKMNFKLKCLTCAGGMANLVP